ncbi:MAG: head maturation protease, ClpP-related [Acetobacter orientalis]|uniref:head maturation protease, ClpP-related n=1 Tax=Acetobacter orientalis TaxID=146474 RepID=UPI0039ED36CE
MYRYNAQGARFSNRALLAFAQTGLAQTLEVRPRAAANQQTEILLYDEIGLWGVTAKAFTQALATAGPGPLTLRINSPGGDVFDGLAMFSALKQHNGPVNVVVDGLAASAASFLALAGSNISMAPNAFLMIHNAWGVVVGNKADMTETASVLAKIDGQLVSLYADKTGQKPDAITQMMDAETWFTAQEAKEAGFIDTILDASQNKAQPLLKNGAFEHQPKQPANTLTVPDIAARRRMVRLAEAAG